MITINLLPVELRPIKRTPIPYILCIALMIGAVLMCFQIFIMDTSNLNSISTQLRQNEEELTSLRPSVDKYNELYQEKQLLATQLETINEIVSDRIYWSYQLHNLGRLSDEKNMWFDTIEVKSRTITVMQPEYNEKTQKTTNKRVRKQEPVLSIKGFVSSGVDGSFSVYDFMEAADTDPEFSSRFVLESSSLVDTELSEGRKVREFELVYKFGSAGGTS